MGYAYLDVHKPHANNLKVKNKNQNSNLILPGK